MTAHGYGTFVHGSMLMLGMRQRRHLPGKGCADHFERVLSSLNQVG